MLTRQIILLVIIIGLNIELYSIPKKPEKIPDKAIWQEKEKCWGYIDNNNYLYKYDEEGNIKVKVKIEKKNNGIILNGEYISWYKNGNKETEGSFVNDMEIGKWTRWNEDGRKYWEVIKNDQGKVIYKSLFNENGKEKIIDKYQNGKLIYRHVLGDPERPANVPVEAKWYKKVELWQHDTDSEKLKWYKNGNIISKGIISKNDPQKVYTTIWRENGSKNSEGDYINNKKEGNWIDWREDGSKLSDTIYSNGIKVSQKFFDKTGKLRMEVEYRDGKVISEKRY